MVKTSRQYDIEFKKVYVYIKNGDDYVKEEVLVPMLFVQRVNLDTYISNIKKENNNLVLVNDQSSSDAQAVKKCYEEGIPAYEIIIDNVKIEDVKTYLGITDVEDVDKTE